MDPQTGVTFEKRGQSVKHLEIRLSTDPLPALQPHRLCTPSSLTLAQILKPLFHTERALERERPLTPTRDFLAVAKSAVTAVGTLHPHGPD